MWVGPMLRGSRGPYMVYIVWAITKKATATNESTSPQALPGGTADKHHLVIADCVDDVVLPVENR